MKAAVVRRLCGPSCLEYADVAEPASNDLVVIDVGAAGVCHPDLLLISGRYQWKPDPPFIPGNEVAGTVRSAPPGSEFAVGQRVSACPMLGGYAERVAVPAAYVVKSPPDLDDASASCLLANYYTAYYTLVHRGGLQAGATVLVFGSAGGIGTATVQVAKALGARVIAMVQRRQAIRFVESLGADAVLLLDHGWTTQVRRCTAGRGVDVVVDQVGGGVSGAALDVITPGGRLLVLGFASGEGIPSFRLDRLRDRNVDIVGVNSTDFVDRVREGRTSLQAAIAGLVKAGLRPPVPEVFPLSDARYALERLARGEVFGKAVLVP
ncbi:NADPH:quinone oxidoreductase family protein [Mycobacterium sp. SMC-4]|uniref:NADPH:quinone oxidoreductase family protein n=1 Tax=Mycobacterium sp. SMC-4 TaxID=2857059 RepID=UPI003D092790